MLYSYLFCQMIFARQFLHCFLKKKKNREGVDFLQCATLIDFYFPVLYILEVIFLVVTLKVKVTQLCPTLWDPMDYTVHGILQARILEWVAYHFSRGSSQPRDRTQVSCIVGSLPAEPQGKPKNTGVGSLSLLHQIFLTQELNQDLLDCRWILYQLSYEGSPVKIQTPSIGVLKCERHCPIALQKLS